MSSSRHLEDEYDKQLFHKVLHVDTQPEAGLSKEELTALSKMILPPDNVNHPPHYGGDTVYEAIKVIEAWSLNFNLGNAVKYLSRLGKKPGASKRVDLEKAIWYLQRELEANK